MASKENVLSTKTSSHSRHSVDKLRSDLMKKRASSVDETNIRNSLHQLQESIFAINFPYHISFEECAGVDEVLIRPSYMEFKDGSEGNVMQQALTIHNVGKKAAIVRLHKPNSMLFDIKVDLSGQHKLYPGLSLSVLVKYTYKQSASLHTMIPIEINGHTLDYHLICTFSAPHLVAEPATLDFGCVNFESVSDVKTLTIHNTGGKTARFSIDVGTNHMINIRPDRGLVKPSEKILLKVQLAGKYEGKFNSHIWIKSSPNICIAVNVEVIKPKLLVECYTKLNESVLIDFPATYLQTCRHCNLTLSNNSSQPTIYVLLAKDEQSFRSISEIDTTKNPSFDVFQISPSTGRLLPFEETTLSISFCPTFESLELSRKLQKDRGIAHFVAVIKIFKVGVEEAKNVLKMDPKKSKKIQQNIPQICAREPADPPVEVQSDDEPDGSVDTTLYLHGPIEIPCLNFQPDELLLNDLQIDERVERSICITNPSERLSLRFAFVAKPWIRCQPDQALLRPKHKLTAASLNLCLHSVEALFYLEFDTWASSADREQSTGPSIMLNVSRISLRCSYNPLKAHGKDTSCRQMCKVASLNKLPLEPNYSLTHSPSQLALKVNHRQYWTDYFRRIFSRERADSYRGSLTQDSCSRASSTANYARDVRADCCGDRSIVRARKQRAPQSSGRQGWVQEKVPRFLSPLQLYKVHVSPLKLDFGKMVENSQSFRQITFENRNDFEITISLTSPQEPSVTFADEQVFAVKAQSRLARSVGFKAEVFGKFGSYVNYTINRQHKYQLPLRATVVFKNLTLKAKEILFQKDRQPLEGYRLPVNFVEIANELNADTAFTWILPENANFSIEPATGCVAASRSLYASVCHQLDPSKSNRIEAVIQDEDTGCANLKVEAVLRAPNVCLVEDALDLGGIALNLEHRATVTLYNAEYFGAFFQVDERSLVKGIDVSPARGAIQPRGIVVLTVRFLFDVCVECSTQIEIVVQKRLTLQCKVKFAVAFPRLKFEPSVVDWKRVCANSCRVQQLSVTNASDAEVALRFLLRHYNEFHVSSSDLKSSVPITRGDNCFKIRAKSTVQLFVHFAPCDLAHYSMHLPIVINELLGPVSVEDSDSGKPTTFLRTSDEYYSNVKGISFLPIPAKLPTVYVNAIVTQPVVRFNKLLFSFDDSFRHDTWTCCNNSEEKISLTLCTGRCSRETDFPFVICWVSGVKATVDENGLSISLKPKEYTQLRITFGPRESGRFAFELPINVDQAGNRQTYNQLILDGFRSRASIETDVLAVNLAPVPLNVAAKQTFNLRLSDFAESSILCSDIRCSEKCYPAMEIGKLLSIIFRRGNEIKAYCSHDVEVEVEFVSCVPVSFCASLLLFDKDKHSSVSIDVSARADDSLLSIYAHRIRSFGNLVTRTRPSDDCRLDSTDPPEVTAPSENVASSEISVNGPPTSDRELEVKLGGTSHWEEASDRSDDSVENIQRYASIDCTIDQNGKSYLQLVARVIQCWLYDDVLNYEFNPNLFDGVSLTLLKSELLGAASNNDKKKEYPKLCTFIDVLKRLADQPEWLSFDESMGSKTSSRVDGADVVSDAVNVHQKIMQQLLSKGALIAHLSAEHLLNYDDYKKLTRADDYLLDEDSFRLRSRLAWIDLLLQSYKVFAMPHINVESLANHEQLLKHAKSIDSSAKAMYVIDVADIAKRSERHYHQHASEALLLGWLEFNNALHFKARSIDGFGECLNDSLAFIAVTINYCPFLRNFFQGVYAEPIDNGQKIHNAVCLLLAWKKIRLGFTLTPSQIVDADAIQMLMLSRHLFKYMPTYLIKSKVTLVCPLTKSTSAQIRLSTNSDQQANYVVQFIDNDLNAFTSKAIVSMYPQKSQQIKVNFFARKILKTRTYLVLCGSSIGPHFAENQVFLLEGYPDELEISESFSFATKLYQIVKKNLSINVPYDNPKEYEIWISRERPNSIDRLAITKWDGVHSSRHAFDRLTFQDNNIKLEEQSQSANVTFTLACLTCESQSFWIIFRSKIADFIIQITSNYRVSITDNVSIETTKESCTCPDFPLQINFECPLVHRLLIPSNNIQLHDCILKLFKNSLDDEDRMFWTRHLDNAMGLRFIKCITKDDDLIHFKQTYDITTDNNSLLLQVLEDVDDGSGYDQMQLTIHICKELAGVKKTMITLTSWNGKEIRTCQVDFLRDESHTGSSRSIL